MFSDSTHIPKLNLSEKVFKIKKNQRPKNIKLIDIYDVLITWYYILEVFREEEYEKLVKIAKVSLSLCLNYFVIRPKESNILENLSIYEDETVFKIKKSILSFDVLEKSPLYYFNEKLNSINLYDIEKVKDYCSDLLEKYYYTYGYDQNYKLIVDACFHLSMLKFNIISTEQVNQNIIDKIKKISAPKEIQDKIENVESYLKDRVNSTFNFYGDKMNDIEKDAIKLLDKYYLNYGFDENLSIIDSCIVLSIENMGLSNDFVIEESIYDKIKNLNEKRTLLLSDYTEKIKVEEIPIHDTSNIRVKLDKNYVYRFSQKYDSSIPNHFIKEIFCFNKLGRNYTLCKSDNFYILVSERIQGQSLCSFINEGNLNENNLKKIMKSILLEIKELQSFKIIHNDIKCENIIINSDYETKIIDFEFSSVLLNHKRKKPDIGGSCAYCAPERFADFPPNIKSDIWSLGVMFAEMIRVCKVGITKEFIDGNFRYEPLFNLGCGRREFINSLSKFDKNFLKERICVNDNSVIEFCSLMLNKCISKRKSVEKILKHEWINCD